MKSRAYHVTMSRTTAKGGSRRAASGPPSKVPKQDNEANRRQSRVRVSSGAKRSAEVHDAILDAAIERVAAVGYHGTTIEGIAANARVGKATVYRWWASKGALVGEALVRRLAVGDVPSTDDTRSDLIAMMSTTVENYARTIGGLVIPALVADLAHDPEARQTFLKGFFGPRRAVAEAVLRRAISVADLPPDTDIELVMDILGGTIFYQELFKNSPLDGKTAAQLVDTILRAPPRKEKMSCEASEPTVDC